jgi:hypothetical protein
MAQTFFQENFEPLGSLPCFQSNGKYHVPPKGFTTSIIIGYN